VAIANADQLLASLLPPQPILKSSFTGEAAGEFHSSFYLSGLPGAAAVPSPGLTGAALTSYAGQIPFPAAVSGKGTYLAGATFNGAANIGAIYLYDRLWHNSSIVSTTTTGQTVTTGALPARDANGASTGVGVQAFLEVSTASTNGSPITNTTITYTDSGGTGSNTGTITSFPATAVAGTIVPFNLAAGDVGIQSVSTLTLGTSYGSAVLHLVLARLIAIIPISAANVANKADVLQLGMPRMYDGSVPWMVYHLTGTAGAAVSGQLIYAQN
jgi:hypothetical protein